MRGEIFQKILEWCEWHQDDPDESDEDADDEDRIYDIPQWDNQFFSAMSQDAVIEMLQAGNRLGLKVRMFVPLVNLLIPFLSF